MELGLRVARLTAESKLFWQFATIQKAFRELFSLLCQRSLFVIVWMPRPEDRAHNVAENGRKIVSGMFLFRLQLFYQRIFNEKFSNSVAESPFSANWQNIQWHFAFALKFQASDIVNRMCSRPWFQLDSKNYLQEFLGRRKNVETSSAARLPSMFCCHATTVKFLNL